jgi:hypothetical protein
MFFIAASISTGKIIEKGINSLTVKEIDKFKEALSVNYSVTPADIDIYTVDEKSPDSEKIASGAEYTIVKTGGLITGIDFSSEDTKKILKASCSSPKILANGLDTTVVTMEIWKADGSAIDTGYNKTDDIDIQTPSGIFPARFVFSNGVLTYNIITSKPGRWKIPFSDIRDAGLRIEKNAKFTSVCPLGSIGL